MHDCYGKVNDMLEIVIVILLQKMVKRMDKKNTTLMVPFSVWTKHVGGLQKSNLHACQIHILAPTSSKLNGQYDV